jgi:AAA domain-containing protein
VLIIFDTLSRCFVGGDENASKDMSLAVAAVGRFQAIGAAVLLVHHPGRKGDHERGHSSLHGALDGMLKLGRDKTSDVITLTNEKQKDEEKFQSISLKLKQVCLGTNAVGQPVTSCVLEATNAVLGALDLGIGESLLSALKVLATLPHGEARSGVWRTAISDAVGKKVAEKSFHNWRNALLKAGYVEGVGPDPIHGYRITEAGIQLLKQGASANGVP